MKLLCIVCCRSYGSSKHYLEYIVQMWMNVHRIFTTVNKLVRILWDHFFVIAMLGMNYPVTVEHVKVCTIIDK